MTDENIKNEKAKDKNDTQMDLGTKLAEYIFTFSGLVKDQDNEFYLWTTIDDNNKLLPLSSGECRAFLTMTCANIFKRIPSKHIIDNVINYFWALATQMDTTNLYERVRFGNNESEILINLNNYNSQYIRIFPNSYYLVQEETPLFKVNPEAQELPCPLTEENSNYLDELISKFDLGKGETAEQNKMLLKVWVHCCFIPQISMPLLGLMGTEGAGKSRLAIWLHDIADPNFGKTLSLHRADDLLYSCGHSRIVVLDNLREIKKGLSDELCRIILGDTKYKRALYTNNDIYKFKIKNILITTSINNIILASDLLDRSLLIRLARLEGKFVSEEELNKYFQEVQPYLFGEIVNNISKAITIKPNIKLEVSPRMKGFGLWGEAVARSMNYPENYFIDTYLERIDSQKRTAVEENLLGSILIQFMVNKDDWQGTINELLSNLQQTANNEEERKSLPKTAGQLSVAMDELKVVLGCANIKYNPNLKRTGNRKYVELLNNDKKELIKNNSSDLIDNESDVLACFGT